MKIDEIWMIAAFMIYRLGLFGLHINTMGWKFKWYLFILCVTCGSIYLCVDLIEIFLEYHQPKLSYSFIFAANAFLFMLIWFLNKMHWKRTSYRICDSIANPKKGGSYFFIYWSLVLFSDYGIMSKMVIYMHCGLQKLWTASKCRPHIYSGKIASIC